MISLLNNITYSPHKVSFAARKSENNSSLKLQSQPQEDVFCREIPQPKTDREILNEGLKEYADRHMPIAERKTLAEWNFATNMSKKNADELCQAIYEYNYTDYEDIITKLKNINTDNLTEQEQTKLKRFLSQFSEPSKTLKKATKLQTQLAQDYHEYGIVDTNTFFKRLTTLIKARNQVAKETGYSNYYDKILEENYAVSGEEIEALFKDFKEKGGAILEEQIKSQGTALRIKFEKPQDIEKKAIRIYKDMGVDLKKLIKKGTLTLDLYPRKNKEDKAACYSISPTDIRICTNIDTNIESLTELIHELAHGMYDSGLAKNLPSIDADSPFALSEAIAMMIEDLPHNEDILKKDIGEQALKIYKNDKKYTALDLSNILAVTFFEQELYKNPDQDIPTLWNKCKKEYGFNSSNENEEYYGLCHIIESPGYYQNYFRGKIMQQQIYTHLKEKFGDISKYPKVFEYLKEHIFQYGTSVPEKELVEKMTGKPLSTEDLIQSLK